MMEKIETVKTIMVSGNSLAVFLTTELKMMSLEKGDTVKVTLERV